MAQLLIWGTTRELIGEPLPPSTRAQQVSSLDALRAAVGDELAALVLADPACLDAERQPLEEWLHDGGALRAIIMAVADPAHVEAVLQRLPFVEDVLPRPVSAASLERRVGRAIDVLQDRRAIRQLEDALARKSEALREVNQIGVALSAEKDIDLLLETILSKSREITRADAGSLYLLERVKDGGDGADRQQLRFKLAQNDSVNVPFEEFTVPLEHPSIAGYAALSGKHVNVADAYDLPPDSPFQASKAFDQASGYRTKSTLVVPMCDHENKVIGVLQLINKKRNRKTVLRPVRLVDEEVLPFPTGDEELVSSLASQAAVALQNARLLQDIRRLFESFVRASVTAIEQRDPTTSGHSERVATLSVTLAERVDAIDRGRLAPVRFTRDQLRELRYAALLHDFGKVGVREKLLIKGKKLFYGQLKAVQQRFAYIDKSLEAELLRRKLELLSSGAYPDAVAALDAEYKAQRDEIARMLKMVEQANEPTVLEEENYRMLLELPQRSFIDWNGERQPYLTPSELTALSIRKGSLSEDERRQVEGHVTHTYEFLSQIPWTGEFRAIPEIAWAHHEKLDGSGYPRKLTAHDIPIQSRMMAISDIYDALVATDRPYKKAVSLEGAREILGKDARGGLLDEELLNVFLEAQIWREPAFQKLLPKRS